MHILLSQKKNTVTALDHNAYDKKLAFKNNATFIYCISKINNTLIDNAEDLDIAMPVYNLLEYGKNYRKTTGSCGVITEMNQAVVLMVHVTTE